MGFEILLPVVLFVVTLIIMFLLRFEDKRDQRSDLLKKRAQALLKNVENSQTRFKEGAQKLEEHISKKMDESHLLMKQVDSQLADLEARSDDLATLQGVLVTYQTSLTQLQESTTQVEQRIESLKAEVATLAGVEERLSSFELRFAQLKGSLEQQVADGEESMRLLQDRFKEMLGASFIKFQEYGKEVEQVEQNSLALIAAHAETLKTSQEASCALVSAQEGKLRLLQEEGDEKMRLFEEALHLAHKHGLKELEQQQRQAELLHAEHGAQEKRQQEALHALTEGALSTLGEELQGFVQQCHGEMGRLFDMTLRKTDRSFQEMMKVTGEYLAELSLRLGQAAELKHLLEDSEQKSLHFFKDEIIRIEQETLKGEQKLMKVQALEAKASASLAQMHQQSKQVQASLAAMQEEKLALLKEAEQLAESDSSEGEPQASGTRRKVEYLPMSEEEILFDEDDDLVH